MTLCRGCGNGISSAAGDDYVDQQRLSVSRLRVTWARIDVLRGWVNVWHGRDEEKLIYALTYTHTNEHTHTHTQLLNAAAACVGECVVGVVREWRFTNTVGRIMGRLTDGRECENAWRVEGGRKTFYTAVGAQA